MGEKSIHCKDCKFWYGEDGDKEAVCRIILERCRLVLNPAELLTPPTFSCSLAKHLQREEDWQKVGAMLEDLRRRGHSPHLMGDEDDWKVWIDATGQSEARLGSQVQAWSALATKAVETLWKHITRQN